jgi:hypothetical protein
MLVRRQLENSGRKLNFLALKQSWTKHVADHLNDSDFPFPDRIRLKTSLQLREFWDEVKRKVECRRLLTGNWEILKDLHTALSSTSGTIHFTDAPMSSKYPHTIIL